MSSAFVPAAGLLARRRWAPAAGSGLCGRALVVPRASGRPSGARVVRAVAKGAEEEEGVLDEPAMRAAEIHEVLNGLLEFKGRIVDDATKLAKKVRAPKKQLEAALAKHPDIVKIDVHIAELEEELKMLGDR